MRTRLVAMIVLACATQGWGADTLLYDPGGDSYTQAALTAMGFSYDLRTPSAPVTAADLASHSLLVVGWNDGGSNSGLSSSILAAGITGRVLLTGHDPDYHAINGYGQDACKQFLAQAMAFARRSGGTGMIALSDATTYFTYLPTSWGITGAGYTSDTINAITSDGVSSGVYSGLTASSMSGWSTAYHAGFSAYGSQFKVLELGSSNEAVTIATPEPATLSLVVLGGLGLLARRRNRTRRNA